jgi:peptidoglycan/LPS O-acetylase OafA/YrhL
MELKYTSKFSRPLDGLRGVAILLVLLFHCFTATIAPWRYVVDLGWCGVDLFFVISGFLITGILLDTRGSTHFFRNFYVRRTLRIFPLYYAVLIVFFAGVAITRVHWGGYLQEHAAWFFLYMQNLLMVRDGMPAPAGMLNHTWSLAVEEQFYLVWPWLVAWVPRKGILWVALFGVVVSVALRNIHPEQPFSYVFPLARMDGLLLGAIVALLIRSRPHALLRWAPPVALVSSVGAVVVLFSAGGTHLKLEPIIRYGYLLLDVFFAALLPLLYATGNGPGLFQRVLSWRGFVFFGKYSYGIYLLHGIVQEPVMKAMHKGFVSVGVDVPGALVSAMFIAGTCLVCVASYHLFERRFLLLKDRLAPASAAAVHSPNSPGSPRS